MVFEKTLHGLFETQVSRTPEAIAVVFEGECLTYAELDARATELAQRLRGHGVGASDLVAIAVDRSPDLVAGLLAILKTGAAYLPIDTSYPDDRIAFMIEDARPACVLTDSATAANLPRAQYVLIDPSDHEMTGPVRLSRPILDNEAAYVIYTSGSTGRPKGVIISHQAIVNYLTWMLGEYRLDQDDRVLQKTPAGFDGAVLEFFLPLCAGAAVVLARPGGHREPEYIAELIARERVTIAQFVPSMLPVFLDEELAPRCKTLRRVYSASDALPVALQQRFRQRLDAELVNLYGPTEATIDAVHWRCTTEPDAKSVPVGNSVRNMRVDVLDARMRRLPPMEVGEIHLAGTQLARGYLGRPALTAERFVADPYGAPGGRLYRTGDLGCKRADGVLEFIGRVDGQVKIRGVRVEPAEIEAALADHPSVVQSAAKAVMGPSGDRQLVAYVVVAGKQPVTSEAIRDYLRGTLPEPLVPSTVVFLDELPLTPNEKLDRAALPVPRFDFEGLGADPADEFEQSFVDLVREVLGVRTATMSDSFIGLGGDSISAIRLASRARHAGFRVSTGEVLRHRTLGDLARNAQHGPDLAAVPVAESVGPFPPTPIMHWLRELDGPMDGFSQSMVLRTPGDAGEAELLACLQAVLDRHDMLRARFPAPDGSGQWKPEILPSGTVSAAACLEIVDAADVAERDIPSLVRVGLGRARSRLSLSAPKLLHAVWFRRGASQQGRLAVLVHHLAIDGVSLRILQTDLDDAWTTLRQAGTPRLAPIPESFRHWAGLLSQESISSRRNQELGQWITATSGKPTPLAQRDLDPRIDVTATSRSRRLDMSPEQTELLLNRAPAVFRTEVNTILLAGFALALAAWRDPGARWISGDFLIELEGHGREEVFPGVDLSRTVGWFTSLFPVRLRLDDIEALDTPSSGSAIHHAIGQVDAQLATVPDKGFGYGLLRYLSPDASARLATGQRADILFNYLGRFPEADRSDWAFDTDHDVAMDESDDAMPLAYAIEVNSLTMDRGEGPVLRAVWKWADSLFDGDQLNRLTELWFTMLARIAEQVDRSGADEPTTVDFSRGVATQSEIDEIESEFRAF